MTFDLQQLPSNLRDAVAAALASERAEKERFAAESRALREMVRLLHLKKFGPKSEKLSDRQLVLLDGEPCVASEEVEQEAERVTRDSAAGHPRVAKEDRQHPGRVELPAHLERRIQVIPVPADQCHCPRCQKELPVIGYEQSECLDMEPVKYFVLQLRREKRAASCGCMQGVVCAAPLPRILPKSKFNDEVILDFIDGKFGQHLPVYRQCDTLLHEADIKVSRQTVCSIIGQVGFGLEAIRQSLRRNLLEGGYIQADETPIGVQSPEHQGRNHTGRIWHYGRPGGPVVVDFQMSRGREGPRKFLEGFKGTLQSDG